MRTGKVARVDVFVDADRTVTGHPGSTSETGRSVAVGDGA
jgi:hypothetical protein